jgi:hypothetical protein
MSEMVLPRSTAIDWQNIGPQSENCKLKFFYTGLWRFLFHSFAHTHLSQQAIFFQRITIPEILQNPWFKKGYKPAKFIEEEDVNLEDINAVFNNSSVGFTSLQIITWYSV